MTMKTDRILSAVAALALLLPAYAFATVWQFQDVRLGGIFRAGQQVEGTLSGSFITSGPTVTGYDFALIVPDVYRPINIELYHFFPQPCVLDDISGGCQG